MTPPSILRHQPAFVTRVDGKRVPDSFFWGAEYCPFCAATRWGIIVALARFGQFNQLYKVVSSPTDYAPDTPSFTFNMSTFTSRYLAFTGYEVEGPFLEPLRTPPRAIRALVQKYNPNQAFPFVDVGNLAFVVSSAYDPGSLAGMTRDQIAGGLHLATRPVTRAIVASANYLSAAICASDGEAPAIVCRSAGVLRADAALGVHKP